MSKNKPIIPEGCRDCDFIEDCHIKKEIRLCYHGDLHSNNIVGSGARNIECVKNFQEKQEESGKEDRI